MSMGCRQLTLSPTQIQLVMAGLGNIFSGIQALEGSHPNLPYLYAFVANVFLIGMQMGMRSISLIFSPFFALFIRGFCLLSVNSVVLWSTNVDISQKDPTTFRMLMKRSILGSLALVSFLGSIPFVPMSIVNSLFNISPIIIYFVEAYNYKKPLNWSHLGLTVICFVGIILIIKPDFLFGTVNEWPLIFMILPIVAAFLHAYSMFVMHELKNRAPANITLHYFYMTQTFFTGFLQNFQQSSVPDPIPAQFYISLVGMVFCAFSTQNLTTRAIYLKKASLILPFGYVSILVSGIVDIMSGVSFDFLTVIGMMMTSLGLLSKLILPE